MIFVKYTYIDEITIDHSYSMKRWDNYRLLIQYNINRITQTIDTVCMDGKPIEHKQGIHRCDTYRLQID